MRSSEGCWTCRLRRKKCDERHPICETCNALHITCHYDRDRPEWMDGGRRQEDMAEQLRREVRDKAFIRRGERDTNSDSITGERGQQQQQQPRQQESSNGTTTTRSDTPNAISDAHRVAMQPLLDSNSRFQRGTDCTQTNREPHEIMTFGRSDTILLMFYLEHLLPFLYPFYRPSLLQGGRAWVLEMMISSPVVRQATLCQSYYFFSLTRGMVDDHVLWEMVLAQTREAFVVLRQALQVLSSSGITDHLHGAVRIMTSIIQVQRFEIAITSFDNCQSHLNAALALFKQLLESANVSERDGSGSDFNAIMDRLGPATWVLPAQSGHVPSAEQCAFRFSSSLLFLDDLIASTIHQEEPSLYGFHASLLSSNDGTEPIINLEAATGCQNWVLVHLGEIAALDAWKKRCKRAGNLDVMDLVRRAAAIKQSLEAQLARLETAQTATTHESNILMAIFTPEYNHQSRSPESQSPLITRIWAHATLIYLHIVVSGWQASSEDVRYHVGRVIELLRYEVSPPTLLRTMVWPFCVAGCLAEPGEEAHFRGLVEALQPSNIFLTVRKALQIMESVWHERGSAESANWDLATCFRNQGDLVLLV